MVVKGVDSKLIVTKFAMYGYNLHPSAVQLLKQMPLKKIDLILNKLKSRSLGFIITAEDLIPIIEEIEKKEKVKETTASKVKKSKVEKAIKYSDVEIIKDITGSSYSQGTVNDFIVYFNSRYEKISKILRNRIKHYPVSSIKKLKMEKVELIGMVSDVRTTQSGNALIEIEDPTGRIPVIATGKLREIALELVGDEVIGISGTLRGNTIIADRIVFPDVPYNNNSSEKKLKKDFSILFLSDTHFGSKTFLKKEWNLLVKWLNFEIEDKNFEKLAEKIKYIIIAGDIIDGVGIYPEQENDLEILDIYQQYEFAAENIDKIPKNIKIIISPGNHDAVRQAEPQPAIPSEYSNLFPNNVIFLGNPALIKVDGIKILIYHGRSFDDLVSKIPRLTYSRPTELMEELLKRRHLAPMYGGKTPIAPEKEDYLVIDEVPDILHTGHIHTVGTGFYKGIFLVNSGCWQSQTPFQRKINLNPTPGVVIVYTPYGAVHKINFYRDT